MWAWDLKHFMVTVWSIASKAECLSATSCLLFIVFVLFHFALFHQVVMNVGRYPVGAHTGGASMLLYWLYLTLSA